MGEGNLGSEPESAAGSSGTFATASRWIPTGVGLAFALWCGTFAGAASARGAMVSHGVLWLAWIVAGWFVGRDLGWKATAPWIGLVAAVAASWVLSPVPRAGTTALVLLPTFLILPRLFALCWRGENGRRAAALGMSVLVTVVSVGALWGWLVDGTDGTSMPLGHHNLLAAFLVTLLPLSALGMRSPGVWRLAALAAGLLGLAALLATRSMAGTAALGAMLVAALLTSHTTLRRRLALAAACLAVLAASAPRLLEVLRGLDSSTLARLAYWRAAWNGFLERPLLGWGPGASHWTLHEHFQPVPGVHPAEQIVADVHSLPLQLLYELGLVGCLALAVALGLTARRILRTQAVDRPLRRAGLLGLLGAAVASLGGLPLSVTALPVALALAAGCVLAATPAEPPVGQGRRSVAARVLVTLSVAIGMAAWLVPKDLAHRDYERARSEVFDPDVEQADPIVRLQGAISRDPDFPLYRWRFGLVTSDSNLAHEAASDARGLAALWLTAARFDSVGDRKRQSLEQVCRTSRFGAVAPYWRGSPRDVVADRVVPPDASAAARAVAAQPWLLAATGWPRGARDAAVGRLAQDERIDPAWRSELERAWAKVAALGLSDGSDEARETMTPTRTMSLSVDKTPSASLSLFAFRRLPWPARLVEIKLDAETLARVEHLPPAWALPTTDAGLFAGDGCGLGEPPAQESKRDAPRRP